MKQNSENLTKTLKERLNDLPKAKYSLAIDEMCVECGKSRPTIYRWISDPDQMGKLEREKVDEILNKHS